MGTEIVMSITKPQSSGVENLNFNFNLSEEMNINSSMDFNPEAGGVKFPQTKSLFSGHSLMSNKTNMIKLNEQQQTEKTDTRIFVMTDAQFFGKQTMEDLERECTLTRTDLIGRLYVDYDTGIIVRLIKMAKPERTLYTYFGDHSLELPTYYIRVPKLGVLEVVDTYSEPPECEEDYVNGEDLREISCDHSIQTHLYYLDGKDMNQIDYTILAHIRKVIDYREERFNSTIIRQGDVEEMTAHELSKLSVKEREKIKKEGKDVNPIGKKSGYTHKKYESFSFPTYAQQNYNKGIKEMDPLPSQFLERRKHFFNATQFYKRKGFDGNILSVEGKNFKKEFLKHKNDDTTNDRAKELFLRNYFSVTIRNVKYKTLGNKITVHRKFCETKKREEARLEVGVSVHMKEALGLKRLPIDICKTCSNDQILCYRIKECDCIVIGCALCKWLMYTTEEIYDLLLKLADMPRDVIAYSGLFKIEIETMLFDFDIINQMDCETNYDIYKLILDFVINPRIHAFCKHTKKKLIAEYILRNDHGFFGDAHIYNCAREFKFKRDKLRAFGEVNLKKTQRVGEMYYNDDFIGIEVEDKKGKLCLLKYTCQDHRSMELYRCKECRDNYSALFNGVYDGYCDLKEDTIEKQGNESDLSDFGTSRPPNPVLGAWFQQPAPVAQKKTLVERAKSAVEDIVTKSIRNNIEEQIENMKEKINDYPIMDTLSTVATIFIKALDDDGTLTPFKLTEYTRAMGEKTKVRELIWKLLEGYIPEGVFDFFFGKSTVYFRVKGDQTKDFRPQFAKSLTYLTRHGWDMISAPDDIVMRTGEVKVVQTSEGAYTYLRVPNNLTLNGFTIAAQGDFPLFLEEFVNLFRLPNTVELLKKLQLINQMSMAFKNVKGFFSFLVSCLPDVIRTFFASETEVKWNEMAREGGLVDSLSSLLASSAEMIAKKEPITEDVFLALELGYGKLLTQVLQMMKEKSPSHIQARALFDEITKVKKNIEKDFQPGKAREFEPTWFEIVGAAGIGKSSMIKALIAAVDGVEIEDVDKHLYTRGPTSYFDGYVGQKTVVFDDFNVAPVDGVVDSQLVDLFLFVSNCKVPLEMAALDKKNTQMSSERMITLANEFVDLSSTIKSKEALERRKTLSLKVDSTQCADYTTFSHLHFHVNPTSSLKKCSRSNYSCTDDIREYGVCRLHGTVAKELNFYQLCCAIKIIESIKKEEHERRKTQQKKHEFHKLLDKIELVRQGDDELESIFTIEPMERIVKPKKDFHEQFLLKFARGKCFVKDLVSKITTFSATILRYLQYLGTVLAVSGVAFCISKGATMLINKFIRGDINEITYIQQSEGKSNLAKRKNITLQGLSECFEQSLTRIEFKKGGMWLKSNAFIIGKSVIVNEHNLYFEDGILTIKMWWRDQLKEFEINESDVKRLNRRTDDCDHDLDKNCYRCMNSYVDISIIDLGKFPIAPFRSRKNWFFKKGEGIPQYLDNVTFITKRRSTDGYRTVFCEGKGEIKIVKDNSGKDSLMFIKTNIRTEMGDCAGIYIYKDRVLAIHFGAETVNGFGLGQIITQDSLPITFESNTDIKSQGEASEYRTLQFIGQLERSVHRSTKTELKHSKLYGFNGPAKTENSILSKFDVRANGVDPIHKGVEKYDADVGDVKVDDEEFIQLYTNSFSNEKKPRILTENEAINGCVDFNLVPMDMTKSAGYGYAPSPQGKRNLFIMTEKGYEIKDANLRKNVDNLMESIAQKNVIMPVSQITLKDERLKIGKTSRVFNNFPVEYTIVARRYLGAFIGCAHSWYADGKFYSIGINLYSNEASMFIRDLLSVSTIAFDGDYKNYDSILPVILIYLAYKAIGRWYGLYDFELDVVMFWFLHPTIAIENDVYIQKTGNSSGNLMTTLMNSMVGFSLLYMAYTNLVPPIISDQNEFRRNTMIKTFGDDNVCAVSLRALPFFNFQTVRMFFLRLGIQYTRADKRSDEDFLFLEGDDQKLVDMDSATLDRYGMKVITDEGTNVEFLKNTFQHRNKRWYALLREDVVTEMVYWIRSKQTTWTQNDSQSLCDNINSSLRFSYFYGRKYFEEWREKIRKALLEEDPVFDYQLVTYMDIQRQVEAYGFIPELDQWSRSHNYEIVRDQL